MTRFVVAFEGDITIDGFGAVEPKGNAAAAADNTDDNIGEIDVPTASRGGSQYACTGRLCTAAGDHRNTSITFATDGVIRLSAGTAIAISGEANRGKIGALPEPLEPAGSARRGTPPSGMHSSPMATALTGTF